MIKTIVLSSLFVLGFGASASANVNHDADAERRAVLKGRQIVWEAVPAQKPFALTGNAVEKQAPAFGPVVRGGRGN